MLVEITEAGIGCGSAFFGLIVFLVLLWGLLPENVRDFLSIFLPLCFIILIVVLAVKLIIKAIRFLLDL